ncbi:hypothetical protein COT44_01145 [Candidatus Shapirobacteria bacterium CG08_land_8_20_14_0_20_39_18]|uniref:Antitoxin SocA-like Panacea domain-containing protein n=1 Tax=Candidatus Shapirobacteria bacterium CG08_land_8_20_14_0_20_39_18 TaxID=1974883 RepID=A0A2M6XDY6_9BACT|nr:MAG: hypothetical protein COT44_01145 [Candidatus Shapirobacteria bacterium CG08_land_8_20_14_0_20_39_18]PJE68040.1 MAG: hypothetical protein COU94_04005 [Candidatus Shapirobacteria bacterium CG10_big_fil_rev_8_21_14_0_10_38_8]
MIKLTKSQQLLYQIIKSKGELEDKTKLVKLQYFADFIHYAFNNQPISQTSIVYTREKQGLLSRNFNSDLAVLKEEGLISESPKYHFRVKKEIETEFNKKEIKTIDFVLKKYGDVPYSDLVSICHSQIPYLSTTVGGVAEFFTAYNLVDEYSDYASFN